MKTGFHNLRTTMVLGLAAVLGCTSPEELPAPTAGGQTPGLLERARQQATAGRWDEATRTLERLLESEPDQIDALVALGQIHANEARPAEAAEVYIRLAELRPENGLYALRAGSYLEVVRRPQEAEAYLERAFRQRPDDPDAAYRLGLHQFNADRYDEAAEVLGRGQQLDSRRPDMAVKRAQALNRLGRFSEALAVLDTALSRLPDEPLLTFQRGLTRNRVGDPEGAAADFRRVLELDPELNRARYALARALLASGRPEEGQAMMAEFAALEEEERQRKTAQLVSHLARAGSDDDPVENRLRLEELVVANPKNPEAHRLLAAAYVREGDYLRATESYARAARLDPSDTESLRRREELLRRMGRSAEPGPGAVP
jgi:superkiller protein 3